MPGEPDIIYVNFYDGPLASRRHSTANAGELNAILASGWGAANASLLLLGRHPFSNTVFIMDNDVARPDGGFGTRYPLFALIGVNPIPTPSDVPAPRGSQHRLRVRLQLERTRRCAEPVLRSQCARRVSEHAPEPGRASTCPSTPTAHPSVTCAREHLRASPRAVTFSLARTPAAVRRRQDHRVRHDAEQHHLRHLHDERTAADHADPQRLRRLDRRCHHPLLKLAVDFGYYGGNPIPRIRAPTVPARLFPSLGDIVDDVRRRSPAPSTRPSRHLAPRAADRRESEKLELTTEFAVTNETSDITEPVENIRRTTSTKMPSATKTLTNAQTARDKCQTGT